MKVEKELLSAVKGKDSVKATAELEAFYVQNFGLYGGKPPNGYGHHGGYAGYAGYGYGGHPGAYGYGGHLGAYGYGGYGGYGHGLHHPHGYHHPYAYGGGLYSRYETHLNKAYVEPLLERRESSPGGRTNRSRDSNDSAERRRRSSMSPSKGVKFANTQALVVPENVDPKMLAEHRRKVYDAQLKADILIHGRDGSMNATYDPYYHDPAFHIYNHNKKLPYFPPGAHGIPPIAGPQYAALPENHSVAASPISKKNKAKK